MDPTTLAALIQGGSSLLKTMGAVSGPPPAPPQRADGYAMGGMLTAPSSNAFSSGATGGAYGGAWSQANIDGSNWTVSTGRATAVGGGTSGGNGGLTPTQTNSLTGLTPQVPALGIPGVADQGGGSGALVLVGILVLAYFTMKR